MDSIKIKKAMVDRDMNQHDLAEAIGVSPATVSNFLTGKRTPRVDTFKSMCKLLGIKAEEVW